METRQVKQPVPAIEPHEVHKALEKVLSSKCFINAHKKKKFLLLVCDFYLEGRAHELNEHILAYDVFGRDKNYNPSTDPIVRVFAHDIRKKLESYYQTEGTGDEVLLEIPPGSYQPVFSRRAAEVHPETDLPTPYHTPSEAGGGWRLSRPAAAVAVALFLLSIAVIFLALSNRQLRQREAEVQTAKDTLMSSEVWAPFLRTTNPTLVILSNPPVLRLTNASDPESLVKDSIALAPPAVDLLKGKFVTNPEVIITESDGPGEGEVAGETRGKVATDRSRTPGLIFTTNDYTGMGEAIGLHYLTDFFRKASRSILLKQSRTLSAEDLKKHNVVLLGGAWVNEWSSKLARMDEFVFTGKATIQNRNPQSGEEREYLSEFDRRTGNLTLDYALITVKPNISSDENEVMMLAGIHSQGTQAAAEYVTDDNFRDQIDQRLRQLKAAGRDTRYFQALLRVGVENGIPTAISILAIHPLLNGDTQAVTTSVK
jgi:hypothetical protein